MAQAKMITDKIGAGEAEVLLRNTRCPLMLSSNRGSMYGCGHAERRQEAHKFRGLVQIETNEEFRETLLSIAKEYEALAASLVPTKEDDP